MGVTFYVLRRGLWKYISPISKGVGGLNEANKCYYIWKVPNTSTFITIGITTSSSYQITKIMISLLHSSLDRRGVNTYTTLPIISPVIPGGPEATGCPIISKDLTDVTPVLMNALCTIYTSHPVIFLKVWTYKLH